MSQIAGEGSRPQKMRAAVIGGGVIGLSTALALAEAGYETHVFAREAAGVRIASWAGGGILSALPPHDIPTGLESLLEESLLLYPKFCQQLHDSTGLDPEYWRCGAEFRHADGRVTAHPALAQVRNPRLLKALAAAVQTRGGQIHQPVEVMGIECVQGQVRGLRTSAGGWAGGLVVICAGAWSAALGARGIAPVKGQMLLLRGERGQLERILIDDAAYLIPRRDGRILVGSTLEDVGYDIQPTVAARTWLLEKVRQLAPGLETLPVADHWAGLRPRPAGGLPLIGPDPLQQGVYHNTGHYRLGITLAPASARRLVEAVSLSTGG